MAPKHAGRAWDLGGPDTMSYQDMLRRIADVMMIDRPSVSLGFNLTPVASVVAAAVAGEDPGLIEPLMESLEHVATALGCTRLAGWVPALDACPPDRARHSVAASCERAEFCVHTNNARPPRRSAVPTAMSPSVWRRRRT